MTGAFAALADRWPDLMDDRALVEAAQEEPKAFDAIYERYAHRVYLYVRSRVSTEEDAVDITQQIFVKSMHALPKYRCSEAPLCSWLFRIARNAVVDHHRRVRPTCDLDAVPAVLRDYGLGPEEAALRSEEMHRLGKALQRLDRDKRELLALRFAGGLKIREIAASTGKSEEAIKKRLARSLKTLREYYDQTIS